MLTKEGILCFWAAIFVYFDGKDGCLSLRHNRSLSGYILPRSRIWVICQEMFLFIIIFVIMQVKDQDQSSSRIMFSHVADGKLFPWCREHFIPQPIQQRHSHGGTGRWNFISKSQQEIKVKIETGSKIHLPAISLEVLMETGAGGGGRRGGGRWVKYLHDYQKLYAYLKKT